MGDYAADSQLIHEFRTDMTKYVQEGKVKVREHITEGIENAGRAFLEVGFDTGAVSHHVFDACECMRQCHTCTRAAPTWLGCVSIQSAAEPSSVVYMLLKVSATFVLAAASWCSAVSV